MRIFDVEHVLDTPRPGQRTALLTARVDLDLATVDDAGTELAATVTGPVDAVLVDAGDVFIGAALIRCLVATTELATRSKTPLVIVRAPHWLIELAPLLGIPPPPAFSSAEQALATLRAATSRRPDDQHPTIVCRCTNVCTCRAVTLRHARTRVAFSDAHDDAAARLPGTARQPLSGRAPR